MKLEIVQAGHPVLRQAASRLRADEIARPNTQQLIADMLDTLRAAPGVGLAAPQVGHGIRLAIIEDREQYHSSWTPEQLRARGRVPVDFHALINPELEVAEDSKVEFYEGCLSVEGYMAEVPRYTHVRVRYLNELGEARTTEATGWYARILQHEIDHLNGTLYIDRMNSRTFMTSRNYLELWKNAEEEARKTFK